MDGAAALACPHCAGRFFVGDDGSVGWLLPPRVPLDAAREAARRWLRDSGRRVTRIGEPRGVLVPLHWVRGLRFAWTLVDPERRARPAAVDLGDVFHEHPQETEPDAWEARLSVSAYAHALPAHPLGRALQGRDTHLQSLALCLLDPDRLPKDYELLAPTISMADGDEAARRWRAFRERASDSIDERTAAHDLRLRMNAVAAPAVLIPFAFREIEHGVVFVDASSGEARGEVGSDIDTAAAPSVPIRAEHGRPLLVPLECPECGAELALRERDRLFPCRNCGTCWETAGGGRRRVTQWFLDAPLGGAGRWLPFWVYGSPAGAEAPPEDAIFVPAYEARHFEAQLHLAVRLTRNRPGGSWVRDPVEMPAGAAVGSAEAAGWRWAVEGALARESFAAFTRFLNATPAGFGPPVGLAWLPFRLQGGDLVELRTGARTRALGAVPWETRRAA
jgi:hypothetical protein